MDNLLDRTYRKLVWPVGVGYDRRPAGITPSSVIIHTTNGNRGSTFRAEAMFLRNSPAVSAHYLVGKDGHVAELLPPAWRAWHAGVVLPGFSNSQSIGIECHHAVGEDWPEAQRQALTDLVRSLLEEFCISLDQVETHRTVALPKGRKIDPSDWLDADFYAWRHRLLRFTVATLRANVRSGSSTKSAIVRTEERDMMVFGRQLVRGQAAGGDDRWLRLLDGNYMHRSVLTL